ncbi:hypothetical protein COU15_00095 [Candidatus Kaiserbacteria bacterium CG10_big_fil_rev_8_21_14_0_10_45_20]|uniref:Magnesium transport protein CorA n=1 Tax=Candidatus Kaiserbacteria bacterium CG10_big_fil_rev_8_21_14_0_10_45_20 TaxID=1974607 RepID=A0A2H0UGE6_9BACT|nr:MAG: hypothetical protein COU15_00095 [Candidatus Kaiserbacteria bacterium CG10_big_fil_rev_8_21_14_0_10_45_20]
MITRFELQGATWINLENPTSEEVQKISTEFSLSPVLANDLLSPTPKTRVDMYPDCAYAVLHFLSIRPTKDHQSRLEMDVVLGKNYMITVQYEPMGFIDELTRSFEAATILKKGTGKMHSGHLFFELSELLYRDLESQFDSLEDRIEEIESEIFAGKEKEMVTVISKARRGLLSHKRILASHKNTLDSMEHAGTSLFGEGVRNYFRSVAAIQDRAYARVLALADVLNELQDTNTSLLYTRQNEIMKNLTIMAFVTFPLSLIAGIFGMNTEFTPFVGYEFDFWIIVGGMIVLTLVFFAYFKVKKWF